MNSKPGTPWSQKIAQDSASVAAAALILMALSGCGDEDAAPQVPRFDDPRLQQGRTIWMQVCRNCHLTGVAGAPAIGDGAAWAERRRKGVDMLYANALQGIVDDNGSWRMPPRGGNDALSDEQVRRAVDYMLEAAQAAGGS
jgi:cytochrome c5